MHSKRRFAHVHVLAFIPGGIESRATIPIVQSDATEAELSGATQVGTQAASPHAIAEVATGSRASSMQDGRPSSWGTAAARPVTTAAEALDRSDLSRMRAFHTFGIIAAIGAIGLSVVLGGDPSAKYAFWGGASLLGACNVVLLYLTTRAELYRPIPD